MHPQVAQPSVKIARQIAALDPRADAVVHTVQVTSWYLRSRRLAVLPYLSRSKVAEFSIRWCAITGHTIFGNMKIQLF